jgi:pilus assembly protein CpaE
MSDADANAQKRMRIFTTGSCEGLADILRALESREDIELVGARENVADAVPALAGGHLDVVLHATRGPGFPADEIAAIREHTRAPIIMLCSSDSAGMLEQALEAGVADMLPLPQLIDNVAFAIRKTSHVGRRSESQDGSRAGRVVTVFSPKGGIGKTSVAVNLACAFTKNQGKSTLLLDLDLQFGDAAIMLGLEPEKTIYDLVVAPGELDHEKLAGYTTAHPCGIDILPAPLRPEDAELVTEGKLSALLEVARRSYDAIVVDTSPFFHGPMLATLDRTDDLLLLCGMDVPTIKNVRLSLQTLDLLSFPQERIRVVLNRANTNVGIKHAEVERALETKIRHDLPSDRAVPLAVNRGKPVVLADDGADFSKAIKSLAKELAPTDEKRGKQAKRRGLFGTRVKAAA